MKTMLKVKNITKDYGHQRGVFDLSFNVEAGEVMGFLGPNGAGKTTTIRTLMGFIQPDHGRVSIKGHDCFRNAAQIQKDVGYLPGEIAFMDDMDGMEFIKFIAAMKKMPNLRKAQELLDYFELEPKGRIKKMSKGMKQKIGLVCALMNEPEILILDEPTSGLDYKHMKEVANILRQVRDAGITLYVITHDLELILDCCTDIVHFEEGYIVDQFQMDKVGLEKIRNYFIKGVSVK